MHAVVADGGELTVVRRLVNFVYGSWNVTWPQDFEPPKLDEGRVLGYAGALAEADPGLSARRFARADVDIVATDNQVEPPEPGSSNVEEIFDYTMRRASGEVFFEKDIPTKNLGRLTPHVDFELGDRIPVRLWGRVLPGQLVTAIKQTASPEDPCGWLVHIGGQVLGDESARVKQTKEFERQIAQERRDRLKQESLVGQRVTHVADQASAAQISADGAQAKAVSAQTMADAAKETADDALAKWRQQKDFIDALQSQQISELSAQQEAMRRWVELSRQSSETVDSWDPVKVGPTTVSYPSKNTFSVVVSRDRYLVGVSVLFIARVNALAPYSISKTGELYPGQTWSPSVGGFEAFNSVSIVVHPKIDFTAILADERRKRGLT